METLMEKKSLNFIKFVLRFLKEENVYNEFCKNVQVAQNVTVFEYLESIDEANLYNDTIECAFIWGKDVKKWTEINQKFSKTLSTYLATCNQ